jgi:uncharacterized membrane protein
MDQNPVSPKVTAAALAAALATIVFFVLALLDVFDDVAEESIAALQGAVTTVLAFVLGYLIRDENREQGKGVPPS